MKARNIVVCLLWLPMQSLLAQFTHYPDNMYADTAFAPFYSGVASGDPLQNRVIIWTRAAPPGNSVQPVVLRWQMANDSFFRSLAGYGEAVCAAANDYTTKVDVGNLATGHQYYYRFIAPDGRFSQTGIAQTLPPDSVKHFKLALVSCSGAWSGYFNGYRRIAERDDIDFVLHVGDYIYDDVDPDEHVRMPDPAPVTPATLDDWRSRHRYYLLDPDLRLARQNKTWIVEWDNHDTHYKAFEKTIDGITAFYEYLPVRMPDSAYPERIYRSFRFGNLADLNVADMYMFRGDEEYAPGKPSILGNRQDAWLKRKLSDTSVTWHLTANQEMMGSWLSKGAPKGLHLPGDGTYFDPGDWDGYPDDRNRLYHFLDSNHIKNFVVLSGDLHMSFVMDLVSEPRNRRQYKRRSGKGAVGVEVLTPSLTAGNMDEEHIPRAFIPLIQRISLALNPHHRWVQFSRHGYTTIDVTAQRCEMQFCYSEIKRKTTKEKRAKKFIVLNGANHWKR